MTTSTTSKIMRPLRVLLVGDEKEDGARLRDFAAESSVLFALEWAGTFEAGLRCMTSGRYDAHLIYSGLGDRSGLDLLRAYRDVGDGAPVIMIGPADRALDIAAMERG